MGHSVDAKYGRDSIFDDTDLRLATLVSERNAIFSENLARYGQEYHFNASNNAEQIENDSFSDPPSESESDSLDVNPKSEFYTRKLTEFTDIDNILSTQESLPVSNGKSIHLWLHEEYSRSRGFELGTLNPSILATTMKLQTTKWTSIALGYISDIVMLVHRFIDRTLTRICPDVKATLLSNLEEGLVERYTKAIDQVRFLLNVERTGTPITLNHYFNDNLEKR